MKDAVEDQAPFADENEAHRAVSLDVLARREFLAGSAAFGAALCLPGPLSAAEGEKSFTILHTNDMHSAFLGMGPSADYTPFKLHDDSTRGGFARLAALIAQRKTADRKQGPVLVLDAGDFLMGTAFGAATRAIGGELRLMARMGYDATTFGNHEFDLGPDGLGQSIAAASKAGRIPALVASNTNFTAQDPALADLQHQAAKGLIRRYIVLTRGGLRFGIFGALGKEATFYTTGAGAVTFADAIETAKEMAKLLRETEKVDALLARRRPGALDQCGLEPGRSLSHAVGSPLAGAFVVAGA